MTKLHHIVASQQGHQGIIESGLGANTQPQQAAKLLQLHPELRSSNKQSDTSLSAFCIAENSTSGWLSCSWHLRSYTFNHMPAPPFLQYNTQSP